VLPQEVDHGGPIIARTVSRGPNRAQRCVTFFVLREEVDGNAVLLQDIDDSLVTSIFLPVFIVKGLKV
jgi:hypothetical protein